MKKNILVISLLCIFVLGSFTFAFAALLPQKDNIQFTENVLYGDPAAAEGLKINYRSHFRHHLFWDTAWTIGMEPSEAVTTYRFSAEEEKDTQQAAAGIRLETDNYSAYYNGEVSEGVQRAFDELEAETGPGESNRKTIHLADYYTYYPLTGVIELPGQEQISWNENMYSSWQKSPEDASQPGTEAHVIDTFQDFFKIPVLSGDTLEIEVSKDQSGSQRTSHSSYGSDTVFCMETISAVTDDACYFTFNTRGPHNDTIDTSLIPGGYGIYCLPYGQRRDVNGTMLCAAQAENLSMIYPLDPGIKIVDMLLSDSLDTLYLFTEEQESGCFFTAIDLTSMETLQRLKVLEGPGDIYSYMIHTGKDYFAFYGSDGNNVGGYRVYSRNEDGDFEFDFLIQSPNDEGVDFFQFYSDATFAYDGQRAALTGTATSTYWWNGAFTVAVYDETGMLYCGEYSTGQNLPESPQGDYSCTPPDSILAEISFS